jgi:hypothetical protein
MSKPANRPARLAAAIAFVALAAAAPAPARAAAPKPAPAPAPPPASAAAAVPPAPLAVPPGVVPPAEPIAFWSVRALGVPDAESREVEAALDAAAQRIAVAGKFVVLGIAEVARRLALPAGAGLAACDGSPDCVKKIAALCAAGGAVVGQIGGLGGTYSVNLVLVAPTGAVVRRSDGVLERGPAMAVAAEEMMARLLMPELHRGYIDLTVDTDGAHVFVDGADVGSWPLAGPVAVAVGKHAVRVTHPAYHDFVSWVDVPYRGLVPVRVALSAFPVLEGELTGRSRGPGAAGRRSRLPFYRTWWFVAAGGVVLAGVAAAIAYGIALPDYDLRVVVRTP